MMLSHVWVCNVLPALVMGVSGAGESARPATPAGRAWELGQQAMEAGQYDRGIGLYLLARQRAALPDSEGELSCEGLLCKAAGELTLARLRRPDEARPCWYLYEVWSELAQRQPALRWLRAAEEAAPAGGLTPAEQRGLQRAWCRCREEGRRK